MALFSFEVSLMMLAAGYLGMISGKLSNIVRLLEKEAVQKARLSDPVDAIALVFMLTAFGLVFLGYIGVLSNLADLVVSTLQLG